MNIVCLITKRQQKTIPFMKGISPHYVIFELNSINLFDGFWNFDKSNNIELIFLFLKQF